MLGCILILVNILQLESSKSVRSKYHNKATVVVNQKKSYIVPIEAWLNSRTKIYEEYS